MSIKSFLSIAIVALVLVSLIFSGFLFISNSKRIVTKQVISQLVSLGEKEKERVLEIVKRTESVGDSVASRTRLRRVLAEYQETGNQQLLKEAENIIRDAVASKDDVRGVFILDTEGALVFTTLRSLVFPEILDRIQSSTVRVHPLLREKQAGVYVTSKLQLEGSELGTLVVVFNPDIFAQNTEYVGLGETGETILAYRDIHNNAVFFSERRFQESQVTEDLFSLTAYDLPVVRALQNQEDVLLNVLDYRNVPVIASTHYIDKVDWGLVAKIDSHEALAAVNSLERSGVAAILIIAVFTLFIGLLMARTITSPLEELTVLSEKVQKGNLGVTFPKAVVSSQNEIGVLGGTLQKMVENVRESQKVLEDKVRDRTAALSAAKAKDEAVLASIGDGLVVTDGEGIITLVNHSFTTLLGYTEEEVIGQRADELLHVHDSKGTMLPEEDHPVNRVLKSGKRVTSSTGDDLYFERSDSSVFPIAVTASPILGEHSIVGVVQVFRDITKEKEVDLAKTQFVSLASHQLRTPLSAIRWYAEILAESKNLTEEEQQYTAEVYRGTKRMIALVNALLNVSRLELGTLVVAPEVTDVVKQVEMTVHELKPVAEKNKVHVSVDSTLPKRELLSDPKLLRIVLDNLLTNAIKYTPENGSIVAHIEELTAKQEFGGKNVEKKGVGVFVRDTGVGIPLDQQDKIFEKLFRAENVREIDTDGSGLGLYIVKLIAKRFGGDVWFESKENEGTTFFVYLPELSKEELV